MIAIDKNFVVTDEKAIENMNSVVYKITHKATGMDVLYVKNKDKNKVFYSVFRTPPFDNSGAPHILEHSVLCGSRRFPAKDLFNELMKGSINTYLNAMTFSDKTMYPLASQNERDFFNLMSVYLDAVFNPLIYEKSEYFMQEGWSYNLNKKSSPIEINGIVYNEMKGAYSNPERQLIKKIDEQLFKNTIYEFDSGGVPNSIPLLEYERLLEFHDEYYRPSNCLIYLYGDLDVNTALEMISDAVSKYPGGMGKTKNIDLVRVPVIKEADSAIAYYSVSENKENGSYYALSYPACDFSNTNESMSLEMLNYILAGNDAAPLRSEIMKSGICGDFSSYYRTSAVKTSFSFVGKSCKDGMFSDFKKMVMGTLSRLEGGISRKLIDGAVNKWEFFINEEDFGGTPKGLYYGIIAASAWVYGNDIYNFLDPKEIFNEIREKAHLGLFEALIKRYLSKDAVHVCTELAPKKGLNEIYEEEQRKRLTAFKSGLSDEELKRVLKQSKALDTFRSKPSPKRDTNKIPALSVSDIPPKMPEIVYSVSGNSLFCPHNQSGIDYINLHFDLKRVPARLIPYCGLLTEILGKTDTDTYTAEQIINEMNIYAGGVRYTANSLYNADGDCFPMLNIKIKTLTKNTDTVLKLVLEVLNPKLDVNMVSRILEETKLKMESAFLANGHSAAINRSLSCLFQGANYLDLLTGIGYYNEICAKTPEEIAINLREALQASVCAENLFISTSSCDFGVTNKAGKISESLSSLKNPQHISLGVNAARNEGYILDGGVCYNAVSYNLYNAIKYSGKLQTAKSLLTLDYLWPEIRNKGGAYGCGCGFSRNGGVYFYSYRDPMLIKTYDVFRNSFKALKDYKTDRKTFSKYVINAIKPFEKPLKPYEALETAASNHLLGITEEIRQTERNEILSTSLEDVNIIGEALCGLEQGVICTLGSKSKIQDENIFSSFKNLRLTR